MIKNLLKHIFTINNDGSAVDFTDYWVSDRAIEGYPYLSIFANRFRLLVPSYSLISVNEMLTGKGVIITRGKWLTQNSQDALELLFDDGSNYPYCVYLVVSQVNRMPDSSFIIKPGQSPKYTLTIYTEGGKIKDFPVLFREHPTLPYAAPWLNDKQSDGLH